MGNLPPFNDGILIMGPYKPLRTWVDEFIPYYMEMSWSFFSTRSHIYRCFSWWIVSSETQKNLTPWQLGKSWRPNGCLISVIWDDCFWGNTSYYNQLYYMLNLVLLLKKHFGPCTFQKKTQVEQKKSQQNSPMLAIVAIVFVFFWFN